MSRKAEILKEEFNKHGFEVGEYGMYRFVLDAMDRYVGEDRYVIEIKKLSGERINGTLFFSSGEWVVNSLKFNDLKCANIEVFIDSAERINSRLDELDVYDVVFVERDGKAYLL